MNAADLLDLSRRDLRNLLDAGHSIDPTELDDYEYKGVSLGLPAFIERLSWKKFKKVFHRDPHSNVLRGWNVRIVQNELTGPYEFLTKKGQPFTFGHFQVRSSDGPGLLIDYGLGQNKAIDPVGRLRDPIVALERGSSRLLLGCSLIDVGITQLATPSYFSLERDVPLTHRVAPPGR